MGDKVALVTAGGSGMGAAAARRLAADGFKVAVLSSSGKGEAPGTGRAHRFSKSPTSNGTLASTFI
jgi:NAD(P)-dependent dehydrogenase (short-subunit alcohol dehydrogenase family)